MTTSPHEDSVYCNSQHHHAYPIFINTVMLTTAAICGLHALQLYYAVAVGMHTANASLHIPTLVD